jgi:uncharacterized alkaline shock family protein YloU
MTEYLIATSVLEAIVRGSLAGDDRVRLHSSLPLVRSHPAEVSVEDEACNVVVHLDARMGEFLPELATQVRRKIADAVGPMTGLSVAGVDVVFTGVFPADT